MPAPPRVTKLSPLRRLTVNTGADCHRHCPALVPQPRRNDRAKASRGSAGGDDQQMVRRLERRIDTVAPVAHHRALPDIRPLAPWYPSPLMDERRNVGLAPAG